MKSENIFHPTATPLTTPLQIGLLVMNAANTLSLASVVDPLRAANRRAGRALFQWQWLTPADTPVTLTSGLQISGAALAATTALDALFVIAGFDLEIQTTPKLKNVLRHLGQTGLTIAGVDGGPWILAEAGILNAYRATTHWEDLEKFATRFPDIEVCHDRYVIDDNRMTTGGAGAALDLMLHLIRMRHGEALAMRTAGALIYEPDPNGARPQSQTSPARLRARAPKVAQAIQIMENHLEDPPAISGIARQLGMSQRNLETRFKTALGTSPGAYFLSLRLDEARRLASDTALPVADIAVRTGFTSTASFARAFKTAHGQSVSALRKRA